MEEIDLISGLKGQKEGSITYFVNLYQQFVFSIIFQMIGKREEAEEITQDVLVKCIEKIDQFQANSSLKTWIYRITRNETINFIRKERRTIQTVSDEYTSNVPSSLQTESEMDRSELNTLIVQHLRKLEHDQREILVLFYLKELTLKEIAEALDMNINHTKVKLFRAREKFGKVLTKSDVQLLNEMRYG